MHLTLPPHVSKFRLGIYQGDFSQPMSLMRVLGPFSAMAKEDPRLELVYPFQKPDGADVGWAWLARCDAIYYMHPNTELDMSVLWLARTMGLPVWTEFVDDVFNVLPTNPHYQAVKNKRAVREATTQAIEWSAVCTAVSETCRDAYPHPERFAIIPEACLWPKWDLPRRKVVSWRGLASHAGDVETILPQLCNVAKDFPDWEWALLGDPTEEFVAQLSEAAGRNANGSSRVKIAPYYSTPFHAIQAWGGVAPYLHLVPLADNEFNRSKSHLAWLEASAIGAAVIVPDHLPEWQQPGVVPYSASAVLYNGKKDFAGVLCEEMRSAERGVRNGEFHPNVKVAREAIYPALTLPEMNQRRWAVLRKLAMVGSSHLTTQRAVTTPAREDVRPTEEFHSRSQAGQDRFVYELIAKPEGLFNGTFLDIGSNDPEVINNTLALEELGWRGVLIDNDARWTRQSRARKSRFVVADAATVDWTALVKSARSADATSVDYVSMDVDEATVPALRNLLNAGVRFRVATIEHDAYRFGEGVKQDIRKLMAAHGYTLLCADVCLNREHIPFEDWFVDLKTVNGDVAARFKSNGLAWDEIFESAECGVRSAESGKEMAVAK
jgi:hypothetical protein